MTESNGTAEQLWEQISKKAPRLSAEVDTLADRWLSPILKKLDARKKVNSPIYPKTINDTVWGSIRLLPWEVDLIDSPLMQRLRGVRQLGMAHLVYPGAVHSRLEHSIGTLEAGSRMLHSFRTSRLERDHTLDEKDGNWPEISDRDTTVIRLASLLHDVGHGIASHATEYVYFDRYRKEFLVVSKLLSDSFSEAGNISPSECLAVMVVINKTMGDVFGHACFGVRTDRVSLQMRVGARILGSTEYVKAPYLARIVSGTIDADKLDYMSRDSLHSGLPVSLDTERLLNKLEPLVITPDNAPNSSLEEKAKRTQGSRFFDVGLSLMGLGAYEHMVIGRVMLYDRLYFHHKVRAAEAMLRKLVKVAEEERGKDFVLSDFFIDFGDDTFLALVGGLIQLEGFKSGGPRARCLAVALLGRNLYQRAYVFGRRFLKVPKDVDEFDYKGNVWVDIDRKLSDDSFRLEVEEKIYNKVHGLLDLDCINVCLDPSFVKEDFHPEHVIVDFPDHSKVATKSDHILTRRETGEIARADLFFQPERWAQAYQQQKFNGYVFSPKPIVPVVSFASKIIFYEVFGVAMSESADRFSKTKGLISDEWHEEALKKGLMSYDCDEALRSKTICRALICGEKIILPKKWCSDLPDEIAEELDNIFPEGQHPHVFEAVYQAIEHLSHFVNICEEQGKYVGLKDLSERKLQEDLRFFLEAKNAKVKEGTKLAGGETDLMLEVKDRIVIIENKVFKNEEDPFKSRRASFQAGRYARGVCERVFCTVIAYRAKNENALLPVDSCLRVIEIKGNDSNGSAGLNKSYAEIRFVIPWGQGVPSKVKPPKNE